MAHDNKTLVRRWFDEVWNNRNRAAIAELSHPEAHVFGLAEPGKAIRIDGFLPFYERFLATFPDIHITVDDVIVEGDQSALRLRATGTHTGGAMGVAPSGNRINLSGIIWTRWKDGVWRLPRLRRRRPNTSEPAEEDYWQPEVAPARAWLEEADVLAAEGRFAEAAHHLLIRSVEDIGRRRPGLVRPALTSRDLARAPAVPPLARQLFAGIAAVVERSLFGGRPVDANDWGECRAAYADFAKTASWKAAA